MDFTIYKMSDSDEDTEQLSKRMKHTGEFCADDYSTPSYVWGDLAKYIPKDKVIWEPFYLDGRSGCMLTKLGFNVIHNPDENFFKFNRGDIVVSNPPFSKKHRILKRLKKLDKPFILILPDGVLYTNYFKELFYGTNDIQIVIPRKRINYNRYIDGIKDTSRASRSSFNSVFVFYKMNLNRDFILE
jgi:hypothetical protein